MKLDRILIPLHKPDGSAADPAERKKLADDLRQRAVAGTDFKTLQKEAYEKVGLQNPPGTTLTVRPSNLPPTQQAILQLKPGEVSQVLQDPSSLSFFKLESKRQLPLDTVKSDIQNSLAGQKMQQQMQQLSHEANPVLNNDYFGSAPAPQPGPPSDLRQ